MGYFSKELQILDRNTVKYMIDQLQEDNDKLQAVNDKLLADNDKLLANNDKLLANNDKLLANNQNLHNENINLRQQHSFDAAKIDRYRSLYGELPDD